MPADSPQRTVPDGTDVELWRAVIADGDSDAFAIIYDRHCDATHRYLARRVSSRELAEDLLSIVFLEAWRSRASARLDSGSARPWILGIARMTLRRKARTDFRHRRAMDRVPQESPQPDHADDVVELLDRRTEAAHVRAAFADLRRVDQDVIETCLWQGLDYASAATVLGVPIGTVKSRLSRARTRLIARLDELDKEHR